MATVEHQPAGSSANGAAARIEVENPATGDVLRSLEATTSDQLVEMVARARAAQDGWEAIGFEGRARVLRRAQKWVVDNHDRIVDTIVAETGKTREDAQMAEVGYAAAAFGFWAKHADGFLADEKVRSASPFVAGRKLIVRFRPVGLVGVIGPWNYPLSNTFGDAIPALAAGNAVILKPSEVTPLTSLLMAECMGECGLPRDILGVAIGRGDLGAELVDHVDMVMFTGSTSNGKKVMARAAETLTAVSLELGGKDPMIVLGDADLERAANAAVHYSMQNGGQTCISVERVYVEAPVYDEFVRKVEGKMRDLRVGRCTAPGTVDVGAITFPAQLEKISRHVNAAREAGARVLVGGKAKDGPGRFYEPTLLVDVDHDTEAMREETFGPTLPIMKVSDADDAVRLANDSPYGLAGSIWTKDVSRGEFLARRLETGAVCINDAQVNYVALELPMGGWKASGMGQRHGAAGIRKYTRTQTLLITRFMPVKKELHMMGYKPRTYGLVRRLLRLLYGRGSRD
jgi:acyl-CoA reductase-like NAD-dependent aldehyde dehydrogenase